MLGFLLQIRNLGVVPSGEVPVLALPKPSYSRAPSARLLCQGYAIPGITATFTTRPKRGHPAQIPLRRHVTKSMHTVSDSAGGDATAQEVYSSRFSHSATSGSFRMHVLHGVTCENVPRARARGSTGFERSGIERGRLVQQRRFPASISPAFASKCVYKIVFFHKSPRPTSRCTPWWLKRPKRSTQFLLLLQKKKRGTPVAPTSWGTFARVFMADSESRSGRPKPSYSRPPPDYYAKVMPFRA